MINELIAAQLTIDEGFPCTPERVLVTAGCQEAIALCLQTLCRAPHDVLLVRNPTYIGATGLAQLSNVPVVALDGADERDCAAAVTSAVARATAEGKRVRALYLIPQFDNPTGGVLPAEQRRALLSVCASNGIVILEDNPYGMFRFEGEAEPSMASLDDHGCVIYLGTYSKTLCPAVRVGCAVLPETLFGDAAASRALYAELVERKSFLTVNTSQLNQALVGGVLLSENGSLQRLIEGPRAFYRRNRDLVVDALASTFEGRADVAWNRPRGGFFLSVDLPIRFGAAEMVECAANYDVVVMPMSFFALDDSQDRRIRIAYSNQTPEEIETGISSFGRYLLDRLHS